VIKRVGNDGEQRVHKREFLSSPANVSDPTISIRYRWRAGEKFLLDGGGGGGLAARAAAAAAAAAARDQRESKMNRKAKQRRRTITSDGPSLCGARRRRNFFSNHPPRSGGCHDFGARTSGDMEMVSPLTSHHLLFFGIRGLRIEQKMMIRSEGESIPLPKMMIGEASA